MATTVYQVGTQTLSSPVLPGGYTNASVTTSAGRPYSYATMDVDTGLTYEAINRKLQVEAVLDSVFCDISAPVSFMGKKVTIPSSYIMKVTSEKGAKTQVMPIEAPLAGVARYGTDQGAVGYERQRVLSYMKIYYNEMSQGVIEETWGMNYNDLQNINYWEGSQKSLSRWFAEDEDKQYHEALLETYSYVLEGTGTALTQNYNPNVYVANTEFGDMPAYSNTPATYRTNINTALAAAATGTNGVNANLDIDTVQYIEYYAEKVKMIKPVNGSYIFLVPANHLTKLNVDMRSNVFVNKKDLAPEEQFTGVIGKIGNILLVKDLRYPTVTCANDYGSDTHTVEYVNPGRNDSRNSSAYDVSSNASWDIGFLLGEAAIVDWMVTPLHFESRTDEYGKLKGLTAFCERGVQLGVYDTDTASNLNARNWGSMAIFLSASSVVATA